MFDGGNSSVSLYLLSYTVCLCLMSRQLVERERSALWHARNVTWPCVLKYLHDISIDILKRGQDISDREKCF